MTGGRIPPRKRKRVAPKPDSGQCIIAGIRFRNIRKGSRFVRGQSSRWRGRRLLFFMGMRNAGREGAQANGGQDSALQSERK